MSNEIKSTSEMLSELTELVKTLVPDKTEKAINPDTQLLLDAIKENNNDTKLSNDIFIKTVISQNDRIEQLAKLINSKECKPTESIETFEETDEDKKFNRKRDIILLSSTIVSAILSYITVGKMPWAFSASIGLLLSFIVTDIAVMIIDKFVLPGNTIKRISQNANATATFLFGFFIVFIVGTAIGYSVITHNEPAEEHTAPSIEQVTIQRDSKPTEQQDTSKQYETSESTKEN